MRILIADDISSLGIAKLEELQGAQVDVQTGLTEEELVNIIGEYDALLVRSQTRVTSRIFDAAKRLKVVGRAGVGVDNIDVTAATKKGVLVINAPDGNTISAAEHTFAMLISLSRYIPQADASVHAGKWDRKSFVGVELQGKTLSIVGMGRIGAEVAKRALGFKMRVCGYDPFLTEERAKELGIQKVSLQDAIALADFMTVHTPLTKETRHLISYDAFSKMKEGVRIVNCARGGIIDELALYDAIVEGKVAGAALDVFEEEPLKQDFPLKSLPNVVLTPHLGASTIEAQVNVAIDVAEEVVRVLQGLSFSNAVNLPAMSVQQKEYLEPYLALGEKIGLFIGQWLSSPIRNLDVTYGGDLAEHQVSFITRTITKGLLGYQHGDEVNYVNAPFLADQIGLVVRETRQPRSKVFTNLISVAVECDDGRHVVSGTLYNGFGPRIVEIDGFAVDAAPDGHILFTRHTDKPGMIGKIGTLLGDLDINIATMQVGRRETGGEAIMLLGVDKVVPDEIAARIEQMEGIITAKAIEIP